MLRHNPWVRPLPLLLVFSLYTSLASAQALAPLSSSVRSAEVVDEGAVAYQAPSAESPRRGTIRRGTRLPVLGRVRGDGCSTGVYVHVEARGFVCEHHLRYSEHVPSGRPEPHLEPGELLPHRYAFVAFDATRAFSHPSDAATDSYAEAYGEGFGVIVTDQAVHGGAAYVRIRNGLWIERDQLRFAQGSDFRGETLESAAGHPVGWVRPRRARVHARPRGPVSGALSHRAVVRIAGDGPPGWVRLDAGGFVRSADLQRMIPAERPASVSDGERWLDLDVSEQVLVAYEGDRPVFATLVSSGRLGPSRATPLGEHRIWVKLAYSDMDDLEREDVETNYSIESVPWVQFFDGSNGLHAAFWHDAFGERRSHGCVNLSPWDARFLFDFTGPPLPPGWSAILPTRDAPGVLIRVRP
jgi:hypothetical protein